MYFADLIIFAALYETYVIFSKNERWWLALDELWNNGNIQVKNIVSKPQLHIECVFLAKVALFLESIY